MDKTWITGEPPRPKPHNPPPPLGRVGVSARSVEDFKVALVEEPGLNSSERGTL